MTSRSGMQESPIAVVGMASIFANAKTLDQYWDNIMEKVDAIMDVPADRWLIDDYYDADPRKPDKTYCKRGGFIPEIDFNPLEFGLPPNILEVTDVAQLLALVVAREVLTDAGVIGNDNIDRDRIGVTLGVGGGQKLIGPLVARLQYPIMDRVLKSSGVSEKDREVIIEKFKKAYVPWEENSFPGMLGNVIAGRITNRFDLGGTNCVVDAACAGSLAAMKMAVSDLLEGRADMMISGGVCCDNSIFMYMSFSKTPAFTTNDTIQPFDHDSKGMMVGEGIGMVALKRLADAERDGDKIYGVIKGLGTSSDGKYKSIYAPRSSGQAKALTRAYEDAGFAPQTIGLLEAHGTGTAAGDAAEFGGLESVFGHENPRKNHIALGSVKSQIGHTKSAAGVAGFMKAILALHHKVLPPTINVEKPNPALNIEDSAFYVNTETRPWVQEGDTPRRAGVSAFGFGGTNFHFALEEYKPEISGAYRLQDVPKNILLTAQSNDALKLACDQALQSLQSDTAEVAHQVLARENGLRPIPAQQPRLAFTTKSIADTVTFLQQASEKLTQTADVWSTPTGMHYRPAALEHAHIAGLFSGQGSQYINMGKEVACGFPPFLNLVSKMDRLYKQAGDTPSLAEVLYPIPVFSDEDAKKQAAQLQLTQYAQPAIGVMSLGLYKIFAQAGLTLGSVAGHSFGELTALCVAGVVNEDDYLRLAKARGQAMAAPADARFDAGTMAAVIGDPAVVQQHISAIPDVQIANFNSKSQSVIAGTTQAVEQAKQVLKSQKIKVIPLPVSAAFHTPLVGHAQQPFAAVVDAIPFSGPTIPVYSNSTGEQHNPNPQALKEALKGHILNAVQFSKEIETMYAQGTRVFIEFGPKNVLSKLVGDILKGQPHECISVNASPSKNSDVQLRNAAAQMAAMGVLSAPIDIYEAPRIDLSSVKPAKLNVKLTAANYVSDKTRKAFSDALEDGYQVSAVQAPAPSIAAAPIAAAATVAAVAPAPVANVSAEQMQVLTNMMLDVVAEKTGYPTDMLELSMDMEADLGIDSIKRVEILGAMQDQLDDMPDLDPDVMSELRTLQQVVDYLQGQLSGGVVVSTPASTPAPMSAPVSAAPVASKPKKLMVDDIPSFTSSSQSAASDYSSLSTQSVKTAPTPTPIADLIPATPIPAAPAAASPAVSDHTAALMPMMLAVVADKTGYPTDMLELSMDMEADLGIDSIKRVEILGAMQDQLDDMPDLDPDVMSELRTLQQVVDYLDGQLQGGVAPVAAVAPAVAAPAAAVSMAPVAMAAPTPVSAPVAAPAAVSTASMSVAELTPMMLEVVADKTGYPTDMLELSMDMEADLGIDSIKRVEILGAMQDQLDDMPDLDPDVMSELRTLQQVVDYLDGQLQGGVAPVAAVAPAVAAPAAAVSMAPVAMAAPTPVSAPVAAPAAASTASMSVAELTPMMLEVVADKTGYPTDMLELSMDMEADLGIDSIKRVEILGAMQDQLDDMPDLDPDVMSELRTLQQVVDYLDGQLQGGVAPMAAVAPAVAAPAAAVSMAPVAMAAPTPVSAPVAAPAAASTASMSVAELTPMMLEVVADKTGYPTDMLELSMDMEADLGIDSIKRVEILGAMQDQLDDMPDLDPDVMSELRTLQQVVDYLDGQLQGGVAPMAAVAPAVAAPAAAVSMAPVAMAAPTPVSAPVAAPAAASTASMSVAELTPMMLEVVADKTGYPTDMLELSMDMEADLGIDSIKRVEILGAMQDQLDDMPDLDPDVMSELRTLQQVVDYLDGQLQGGVAPMAAVAPAVAAPAAAVSMAPVAMAAPTPVSAPVAAPAAASTASMSVAELTPMMLEVVAEKTGYPTDMLELSMDMEADLGIDSIKRVEILGAMQDQLDDMPDLDPDVMSELRTLQQVVDYLDGQLQGGVAPVAAVAPAVAAPQASAPAPRVELADVKEHAPSQSVSVVSLPVISPLADLGGEGHFILIDDGTDLAPALCNQLQAKNLSVTVLRWPTQYISSHNLFTGAQVFELKTWDEQAIQQQLQMLAQSVPIQGLIVLQPDLSAVDAETVQQFIQACFMLAKHSHPPIKAMSEHTARTAFLCVSRVDGCLGYGGQVVDNVLHSALYGLCKTAKQEWPEVFCRAIDISPSINADTAANNILAELYDANNAIPEVGYSSKGRVCLQSAIRDSYDLTPGQAINSQSVFLVSGGAKGVTRSCILRLAARYQSKFILLGRSALVAESAWANGVADEAQLKRAAMEHLKSIGEKPTPAMVSRLVSQVMSTREIHQTLDDLVAFGAVGQYLSVDVTDANALQAALRPVEAQLGAITGVIHGAGVLADKLITQKTADDVARVYATKVRGLDAMLSCVNADQLKHLVVFSSAAGFYGNIGQSDYSASNEVLNKTALNFKRTYPNCHVLSFNWGPWDGGMVSAALKKMFAARGVYVIPIDSGAQLFVNELASAQNNNVQVLIGTAMTGEDDAFGGGQSVKKPQASSWPARQLLTAEVLPAIKDHVIGGNLVLPTVCATAWMVMTALPYDNVEHRVLHIFNYKLFNGVILDSDAQGAASIELDAQVEPLSMGKYAKQVKLVSHSETGQAKYHYQAEVSWDMINASKVYRGANYTKARGNRKINVYENGALFHGKSFQGIKAVVNSSLDKLTLKCKVDSRDLNKLGIFQYLPINPLVDDLALQALLVWTKLNLDKASLPTEFKSWVYYKPVPIDETFYLSLDLVENKQSALVADITLHDRRGVIYSKIRQATAVISSGLGEQFRDNKIHAT